MEKTFLRDNEWASIDGKLCLVRVFSPMAKIENDSVVSMSVDLPYASVCLKCEKSADDITGFITNETDFRMLWAAFKQRTPVRGTRLEVYSSVEQNSALRENEEVWLIWTKKKYRSAAKLLGRFLPRLVVMVSPKGAFELEMDDTIRPELTGEARWMAIRPIIQWTPEVMIN